MTALAATIGTGNIVGVHGYSQWSYGNSQPYFAHCPYAGDLPRDKTIFQPGFT
jgi:hypothetical protein